MNALTVAIDPGGVFLQIEVGTLDGYARATARVTAMIDTGATMSAIDPSLAEYVGAPSFTTLDVNSAIGVSRNVPAALVTVGFGPDGRAFDAYMIEAVAIKPSTPGVSLLIGMDLLLKIGMAWDGPGRSVTLTFPTA